MWAQVEREKELQRQLVLEARQAAHEAAIAVEAAAAEAAAITAAAALPEAGDSAEPMNTGVSEPCLPEEAAETPPAPSPDRKRRRGPFPHTLPSGFSRSLS